LIGGHKCFCYKDSVTILEYLQLHAILKMRELSLAIFGIDQPLKGIGISLLRELVQQKIELPIHQMKIVCITDQDGYQFHVS
jgi:hypothetical protein